VTAQDLVTSFPFVLKDIFERDPPEIPWRFAKYFVTIVNKSCSSRKIMELIKEQELYDLCEQLLTRLLIDNLDKMGDEGEGDFILKNLNGSMLRCLENCEKTAIFCVLFNMLRRYKDSTKHAKLPGLLIKCLLKLSKILEKVIPELDPPRVLIVIHLYLISINHEKKSNNDDIGIRIVKTLVHEMVKEHKHAILESYRVVDQHEGEDKHLKKWINIILNSFGNPPPTASTSQAQNANMGPEEEVNLIIEEMKQNSNAVEKLDRFLKRNPHLNFDYYLRNRSDSEQKGIKAALERYRHSLSDSGSTPHADGTKTNNWTDEQPQDRPSQSPNAAPKARFGLQSSAGQKAEQP